MRKPAALLSAGTLLATPCAAFAHGGGSHGPWAWTLDPWVVIPLVLAAVGYAGSLRRLRGRAGAARAIRSRHIAAFYSGLLVLVVALVSPLDALSDLVFSAHMAQHLLLMLAAAPLCVYGRAGILLLWLAPRGWRRRAGRWWSRKGRGRMLRRLFHPLPVWLMFCGVFLFWHLPAPYETAVRSELLHALEHLSLFLASYAFWSVVIEPSGRRRLDYGATLLYVVAAAILGGLPGALLIFAPFPLYDIHAAGAERFGLTLLEDQQLAGVIMWVPAGLAYLGAASILFLLWLQEAERRAVKQLARRGRFVVPLLLALLMVLPSCKPERTPSILAETGGDPEAGAERIAALGCTSCHVIPGIEGKGGHVGPPLTDIGRRVYIAGMLRNTPENMMTWIMNPQSVVPGNAMPDMGIEKPEARDIVAYLYTLR